MKQIKATRDVDDHQIEKDVNILQIYIRYRIRRSWGFKTNAICIAIQPQVNTRNWNIFVHAARK